MDVGAFVQENKRWLLGCAIGGVVWWIASAVLDSVHDARLPSERALGAPAGPVFDQAALAAARTENEQLLAERQRLQQALAFEPSEKYQLAGKGSPGDYLFQISRDLKQAILTAANQRDVQIAESNVSWEVPTGIDDIRATLFGLELVDELQQRLFAAHDATRAVAEDAPALRAILSLKLEARRNQRNQMRSTRTGEIDVRDYLTQEQVAFQFQADEPTLLAFFESCRQSKRTLVVDSWQVLKPARPGEPCTVKGTLVGIAFKDTAAAATAATGGTPAAPVGTAKGSK